MQTAIAATVFFTVGGAERKSSAKSESVSAQMKYAWHGNLRYESENLCLLYLIKYYRENNVFYPLSLHEKEQLQKNNNYLFYSELCDAYKAYKCKDYSSAEQILLKLYSVSKEFRFLLQPI